MFGGKKSFFNTRKLGGKLSVTKQVKKIYLRTDIPCGCDGCGPCCEHQEGKQSTELLDGDAAVFLIPDTNVILHNIDAIESPDIRNVIVLDTVLGEVKGLNRGAYDRLAKLIKEPNTDASKHFFVFSNENHRDTACQQEAGESMNDCNDRAIRTAARWYRLHLDEASKKPHIKIIVLTHDKANKEKAEEMGLLAMSISDYVKEYHGNNTNLIDRVQNSVPLTSERRKPGDAIFETYLTPQQLEKGIRGEQIFKGPLRQTGSNLHEGFVSIKNKESRTFTEYLISSRVDLNRCIDGDLVAIQPFPVSEWTKPSRLLRSRKGDEKGKENKPRAESLSEEEAKKEGFQPTAKIVALVENKRKPFCGSIMFDPDESSSSVERVLFRPMKSNIPYISIATRQVLQYKGKRLQVVIDSWSECNWNPDGHVVRILGDIGDKDVEAEVILLENDVPHYQFSQEVLDCLPVGEWRVEDDQVAVRKDFRDKNVVSVDPPGCKDIDDALHCERLPNGNLEVGVHIADVTHFMKEGTALDLEASKRCTSVYLVDRRIDMLPKLLTENLCSLVGNEERYTFSVVWELTQDCNVVNVNFTKGIIRSRSAMSYYTAQEMVDDPSNDTPIATSLKDLLRLSKILKARRIEAGALTLASQEMKFTSDGQNNATDVQEYVHIPTMSMIEEFMLFANVAVAKKIHDSFPQWACLRRHPAPSDGSMDSLNEALAAQKMPPLSLKSSLDLANSLDQCNDKNDPYFNKLVRMLATRCMQQAKYFSSGEFDKSLYWHYGLAMEIYTHFTSPIRRFADVIVHRQLAAAIGIGKRSDQHMDADAMLELTTTMNTRNTAAQHAGRDSRNLYIGFVFDNYKDGREIPEEDGYVIRILDNGVVVMVPRYGTEGVCFFDECPQFSGKLSQLDKVRVKITLRPGTHGDIARNKLLYEITSVIGVVRVPEALQAPTDEAADANEPPSEISPCNPEPVASKKRVKKVVKKVTKVKPSAKGSKKSTTTKTKCKRQPEEEKPAKHAKHEDSDSGDDV
eukprot:TRINITY_DN3828_c0_g1_i2.p1 TRINITY_DN3828_c0_g1~~TRINITY_DN3828_c0_g1_i2.p1  ORF type:complete len:1037 (+),score=209.56 TRINITY_DN3828_c0_g1_i2:45-3113(+)